MAKEYIVYCDESDQKGVYYSNFYGGALIDSRDYKNAVALLDNTKKELNLHGEVKWTKITENYADKYIALMETFFYLIQKGHIKVRIMFTQNRHIPLNLTDYHKEHSYFILYYQFIKHAFGFQFANITEITKLRVYMDKLPDTDEKCVMFKSILKGLGNNKDFRKQELFLCEQDIADVDSKKHVILQCVDIILGAMQFKLNDLHKVKNPLENKRAKRTIAKAKVYKKIYYLISEIFPNFNVGMTTGTDNDLSNCKS